MQLTDRSNVVVPEGHSVVVYDAAAEPAVQRTESGLVLAHFGVGGDDPDEIFGVAEKADALLRSLPSTSPAIHFARTPRSLSKVFAPASVDTLEVRAGVVWTARQDGLATVLDVPALAERLLAVWQRLSFAHHWLAVADDSWSPTPALDGGLRSAQVGVFRSAANDPVLVEVRRPDGLCIHGFVGQAPTISTAVAPARPLARAPRLRRLLLDAVSGGATGPLFQELRGRQTPLVFFVDKRGVPPTMKWPGEAEPFLPVFGDLRALDRAGRELGAPPQGLAVAAMRPTELSAWARKAGLRVVLGVYPDEGAVRYLKVDPGLG